jgi:hypothetical protein
MKHTQVDHAIGKEDRERYEILSEGEKNWLFTDRKDDRRD